MSGQASMPTIREEHVTTADGVDIACFECGEGPPCVMVSAPPFVDTRLQWRSPVLLESTPVAVLAQTHRVIQFDPRGCGSSQRNVRDYSLASRIEDYKAVMERYASHPIPLIAAVSSVAAAIAYVAGDPGRVSHLIITDPYVYGPEFYGHPQIKAMLALREYDWEFYTETVAHGITSWRGDNYVRELARLMRSASSPDAVQRFFDADMETDVRDLLPKIRVPTLVTQSARLPLMTAGTAERLANNIPSARLRILDTAWGEFDAGGLTAAIKDFIGDAPTPSSTRPTVDDPETRTDTAIILFVDIADSTALTERIGDAQFHEASRIVEEDVREAIRGHDGTPVEGRVLGDGVMGVFTSASRAIAAARRCVEQTAPAGLLLHVGLHAGDVMQERGNVYGGAVNIASRICGLSAPGEILVSSTVRDLARTSARVTFSDRGEHTLKGIADAQRLFAVNLEEGPVMGLPMVQ